MKENKIALPDLNCGMCGFKTCAEFGEHLNSHPEKINRCIHLSAVSSKSNAPATSPANGCHTGWAACPSCDVVANKTQSWQDSLGRNFDFILDLFPDDPGPRETIRLHNPMLVRELKVQKGDQLTGRPLGMSCGCPITHCGIAIEVDQRNGIIVWCVTGPLTARENTVKDLGYYSAEAYEGIILDSRVELKIGMRYWFMPHKCMLQWRHSGLVNFINKNVQGTQVRLEGLLIG
ncbi:MAG: (Fe-S)-binding protein [Bacillota bacterium]|jgi:uncharacterized Fe-S cluster-containing protein